MRPLRISAADQVIAGLTTVQEILTVLPPIDAFDHAQP
jgi:general secretion pathway protein E